jgi:nitrilase
MEKVVAAAVQATPVFLDREATVDKACRLILEAAANGAGLVVFPETFVPTYPDWVWRSTPWSLGAAWFGRLQDQAVVVPSAATEALGRAARRARAYVSIGVNERDPVGSTLYNTQLYLGPDGSLLGKHRKLVPTGGERLVWGMGDGSTLEVFDTPFGRLGGLICWENYMPLARYALYAKGIDVWTAPTWDNSDVWVPTLRHIAKEGRVHVIGVAPLLRGSDVPADLPGRDELYGGDEDWLSRGNSTIVGPRGEILAGPLEEQEGILYAELDPARARAARVEFDPVGHYARPDVFRLAVDARQRVLVSSTQDEPDRREPTMDTDASELHRRAADAFGARVHIIGDDQWELPTPCSEWNVRQLVNHLVYENRWTAPIFAGRTIAEVGDRFEGDLLGDDPRAAWDDAAKEAVAAVQERGALGRTVHLSFGDVPGSEYAMQLFADHLIHGWDLARAIGSDERLDPELVDACAGWFAEMEDGYRSTGAIGPRPQTPPGADAQTRLLAAFGRTT